MTCLPYRISINLPSPVVKRASGASRAGHRLNDRRKPCQTPPVRSRMNHGHRPTHGNRVKPKNAHAQKRRAQRPRALDVRGAPLRRHRHDAPGNSGWHSRRSAGSHRIVRSPSLRCSRRRGPRDCQQRRHFDVAVLSRRSSADAIDRASETRPASTAPHAWSALRPEDCAEPAAPAAAMSEGLATLIL